MGTPRQVRSLNPKFDCRLFLSPPPFSLLLTRRPILQSPGRVLDMNLSDILNHEGQHGSRASEPPQQQNANNTHFHVPAPPRQPTSSFTAINRSNTGPSDTLTSRIVEIGQLLDEIVERLGSTELVRDWRTSLQGGLTSREVQTNLSHQATIHRRLVEVRENLARFTDPHTYCRNSDFLFYSGHIVRDSTASSTVTSRDLRS